MTNKNIYNRLFWLYVEFYKKWYNNQDYTENQNRIKKFKNAVKIDNSILRLAKKDANEYAYH